MAAIIGSVNSGFHNSVGYVKTNVPLAFNSLKESAKSASSRVHSAARPALAAVSSAFAALVTFAHAHPLAAIVAVAGIIGGTLLAVRLWNNHFNPPAVVPSIPLYTAETLGTMKSEKLLADGQQLGKQHALIAEILDKRAEPAPTTAVVADSSSK